MELVLLHPEIPQNTGTTARLAAAVDVPLHLVEPLGFSLDSRHLKRAGLDYWPDVEMHVHRDWSTLLARLDATGSRPVPERLRLFSARGGTSLFDVSFAGDDILVFGCESTGLPASLLEQHRERRVRIPTRNRVRSLNLANAVCLGAYVALHASGRLGRLESD